MRRDRVRRDEEKTQQEKRSKDEMKGQTKRDKNR